MLYPSSHFGFSLRADQRPIFETYSAHPRSIARSTVWLYRILVLITTFTFTCVRVCRRYRESENCRNHGHLTPTFATLPGGRRVYSSMYQHLSNSLMTSMVSLSESSRMQWAHTGVSIPFSTKSYVVPKIIPTSNGWSVLSCFFATILTSVHLYSFFSLKLLTSDLHCVDACLFLWFLIMIRAIFAGTMHHCKISSLTRTGWRIIFLILWSIICLLWMTAWNWLWLIWRTTWKMVWLFAMLVRIGAITFTWYYPTGKELTISSHISSTRWKVSWRIHHSGCRTGCATYNSIQKWNKPVQIYILHSHASE